MKLRIPDKIRSTLGRKYLDWAEVLPKSNKGAIALLQITRRHQKKRSKRAYERSRPPQGSELEYLGFRLIEMFHIEDSEQLLA
jgi:hypothetical protein